MPDRTLSGAFSAEPLSRSSLPARVVIEGNVRGSEVRGSSKKRSFGKFEKESKKLLELWQCFFLRMYTAFRGFLDPENMEVLMKSWSGRATLAGAALLAASAAFPSCLIQSDCRV